MSASTWRLHLPGVQTVLGQRRSWISIPPPGYLDGPGEPACAVTLNYVMEIVQGSRFRCLRGNRALSTWTNGIQTKSRIQLPGQAAPSLGATHENSDWNFKKIRKIKVDPVISCVLHWEFWGQMPQLIHLAWCPAYTGCSGNLAHTQDGGLFKAWPTHQIPLPQQLKLGSYLCYTKSHGILGERIYALWVSPGTETFYLIWCGHVLSSLFFFFY